MLKYIDNPKLSFEVINNLIFPANYDNVLENNYRSRNILFNKVFRDADLSNIELNKPKFLGKWFK